MAREPPAHHEFPPPDSAPTVPSLAAAHYHRCVNQEHMAANINLGGAFPVYLWCVMGGVLTHGRLCAEVVVGAERDRG